MFGASYKYADLPSALRKSHVKGGMSELSSARRRNNCGSSAFQYLHDGVFWFNACADCWIGKGFYGDVFLSKAFGIRSGEAETLVLVKSLLSHHDVYQAEFYREADVFSRVNHEHVVRLLGVCREIEPLFLITEYCEWVSTRCIQLLSLGVSVNSLKGTLKPQSSRPYTAVRWLVHWPLMGGLLHCYIWYSEEWTGRDVPIPNATPHPSTASVQYQLHIIRCCTLHPKGLTVETVAHQLLVVRQNIFFEYGSQIHNIYDLK